MKHRWRDHDEGVFCRRCGLERLVLHRQAGGTTYIYRDARGTYYDRRECPPPESVICWRGHDWITDGAAIWRVECLPPWSVLELKNLHVDAVEAALGSALDGGWAECDDPGIGERYRPLIAAATVGRLKVPFLVKGASHHAIVAVRKGAVTAIIMPEVSNG